MNAVNTVSMPLARLSAVCKHKHIQTETKHNYGIYNVPPTNRPIVHYKVKQRCSQLCY